MTVTYAPEGRGERAEVRRSAGPTAALTDSLEYWPVVDGRLATVDAAGAAVTILDPSGATAVARATGIHPDTRGALRVTRLWADPTFPLGEDFQALWEIPYTAPVPANEIVDRQYFDVVLTKLRCPVDDSHLLGLYPDLVQHLAAIQLTTAAPFVAEAWSEIMDSIRGRGNRPALILDAARLRKPALHLALALVSQALAKTTDSLWYERAKDHQKKFGEFMGALGELKYDSDQDGLASDSDVKAPARPRWRV